MMKLELRQVTQFQGQELDHMRRIIAAIPAVLVLVSSAPAAEHQQILSQRSPQAGTHIAPGATATEILVAGDFYGYPYYEPYRQPVYRYNYYPYGSPYLYTMPPQPAPLPPGTPGYYDLDNKGEVRCDNAVQGCYRWSGRQGTYIWDTNKTEQVYRPWAANRGYPPRQQ